MSDGFWLKQAAIVAVPIGALGILSADVAAPGYLSFAWGQSFPALIAKAVAPVAVEGDKWLEDWVVTRAKRDGAMIVSADGSVERIEAPSRADKPSEDVETGNQPSTEGEAPTNPLSTGQGGDLSDDPRLVGCSTVFSPRQIPYNPKAVESVIGMTKKDVTVTLGNASCEVGTNVFRWLVGSSAVDVYFDAAGKAMMARWAN